MGEVTLIKLKNHITSSHFYEILIILCDQKYLNQPYLIFNKLSAILPIVNSASYGLEIQINL